MRIDITGTVDGSTLFDGLKDRTLAEMATLEPIEAIRAFCTEILAASVVTLLQKETSGGRVHAWPLSEGLDRVGLYLSNVRPRFKESFRLLDDRPATDLALWDLTIGGEPSTIALVRNGTHYRLLLSEGIRIVRIVQLATIEEVLGGLKKE